MKNNHSNPAKLIGLVLIAAITIFSSCNQITQTNMIQVPAPAPEMEEILNSDAPAMRITLDETGIISKTIYNQGKTDYIKINETSPGKYVVSVNLRPMKLISPWPPKFEALQPYTSVRFSVYNNGSMSGYMLNIGDSSTCNGGGGDGGTQSNDSEIEITNNRLRIFQSDAGNGGAVRLPSDNDSDPYATSNFLINKLRKRIRVDNNRVTWWDDDNEGQSKTVVHKNIFALDGQEDTEGSENYMIYAGINRTVGLEGRAGSGITDVYIYVENPVPSTYTNGTGVRVMGWYDAPHPKAPSKTIKRAAVEPYDASKPAPAGYTWHYIGETAPVAYPKNAYVLFKNDDPNKPGNGKWHNFAAVDSRQLPVIEVID